MSLIYGIAQTQVPIAAFKQIAGQFLEDSNMSTKHWHKEDIKLFEDLAKKINDLHFPPVMEEKPAKKLFRTVEEVFDRESCK